MSNRRRQIEDYAKEGTKTITLSIPISQWQMLETFAEATHRPINDVVSDVFSDTAIISIRRMLASNAKPSQKDVSGEPAVSALPDLAAAELTSPLTILSDPPSPKATPAAPSAWRPVENPLVNDLSRPQTPRDQQPPNLGLPNLSRPPQASTTPPSAMPQPAPPLNRGEPLPPTSPRLVMPPSAKPPLEDSERPALATDSIPKSPHANE